MASLAYFFNHKRKIIFAMLLEIAVIRDHKYAVRCS
jgi:hypothetical protein